MEGGGGDGGAGADGPHAGEGGLFGSEEIDVLHDNFPKNFLQLVFFNTPISSVYTDSF